jgi:predicted TIM-barrel fold metal-dependent hydrolase
VGTPVIDSDAHVTEPADLWTSRMTSERWGDLIPQVRFDAVSNTDSWFVGDERIGQFGGSAAIKVPDQDYPMRWQGDFPDLPRRDDLHPSSWDATERLKIMDRHGIAVAALFGNLGVSKNYFRSFDDESFKLDLIRTYNDFLIEWTSVAPERFIPLANLPFWDTGASAKEAARAAGLGHKGVVISGIPERHGLPPFAHRSWDELWEACSDHHLPIHFHAGGGDISHSFNQVRHATMGGGAMHTAGTTNVILDTAVSVSDLLVSGVLPRFPDTRWIVVESAVGYLPFVLESVDYHFNLYMRGKPEYAMYEAPPSEYFHRQMYGTYWFERLDQHLIDRVGARNMMFETDYPHPTCLLEDDIREATNVGLADIGPEDRGRILWRNAAELYRITTVPDVPSLAA